MEERIEIAPELTQLIEAKKYEDAKNFINNHFKSDKPHRNIEFLTHQLPSNIDAQKSIEIRNNKQGLIKKLTVIYLLALFIPLIMYWFGGDVGLFTLLSLVLILSTIPYIKLLIDNSIKIKITPKHLEFYKKGLLERQLELNNILTGYAHIKYVGRSLREYYYLSIFFKDSTEPFQRRVVGLEYTSEQLGAIINEYMAKK